jgi:hypothetical protein
LPVRRIDAIWCAMRRRSAVVVTSLACALVWACSDEPRAAAPAPAAARQAEAVREDARADADAGNWARNVAVVEGEPGTEGGRTAHAAARAAVMPDDSEDTDEPTAVTRLVYSMSFSVPGSFRDRRAPVSAPAGELHVDVSTARLRARFVGPGWPAADGSEVRLRADLPGVYLFDGQGGRSLGAGQLASWFEGRGDSKAQALVAVRHDYGPPKKPIEVGLLCALLAEWAHQPRAAVMSRCAAGVPPPGFRIGPWKADLTAVVPMELPRRTLRADEVAPPARTVERTSFGWLELPALGRLLPLRPEPGDATGALEVENQTDTRAVVLAQGVPVGWVDAGATLRLSGLHAGVYRVGAIRPLGVLRMRPKLVRVPGRVVMSHNGSEETAAP